METNNDKIIKSNEDFLGLEYDDRFNKIKKYFIENSLDLYYDNLDEAVKFYIQNVYELKLNNLSENSKMIELIYLLFIKNSIENIKDLEFVRLQNKAARDYYSYYIEVTSKLDLKSAIQKTLTHFKSLANSKQPLLYFGNTYGEIPFKSFKYNGKRNVYINLASKKENELINLSIVKLKMEEDFTSFTLNKFVEALFELKIITEPEKDKFIYGFTDKSETELFKFGLSKKIIQQLKSDSQIQNIYFDKFGNLSYHEKFKNYLDNLDEFNRFELKRYF